jgi:hypothetical protein
MTVEPAQPVEQAPVEILRRLVARWLPAQTVKVLKSGGCWSERPG